MNTPEISKEFAPGDVVSHASGTGSNAIIIAVDGRKAWTRRGNALDIIELLTELVHVDSEPKINFLEWYSTLPENRKYRADAAKAEIERDEAKRDLETLFEAITDKDGAEGRCLAERLLKSERERIALRSDCDVIGRAADHAIGEIEADRARLFAELRTAFDGSLAVVAAAKATKTLVEQFFNAVEGCSLPTTAVDIINQIIFQQNGILNRCLIADSATHAKLTEGA